MPIPKMTEGYKPKKKKKPATDKSKEDSLLETQKRLDSLFQVAR